MPSESPRLNAAYARRAISTFSCDIARAVSRGSEDGLGSNQRPLACEAAVRQARIGVIRKPKCLPDVRGWVGGFDSEECG